MSRTVILAGYALWAAVAVAYEVAARLRRRTPTLVQAVRQLTRQPVLQGLLLAGWLWLGWHLFVRSTGR
jgi:hypothetical protein